MRVCVAHNFYQQSGGEDTVFRNESSLLEERGHHVFRYTVSNDTVDDLSRVDLLAKSIWNKETYAELKSRLLAEEIEIVHVHNTLPLISPSIYYAAHDAGATVVQTLHNYRLLCPQAQFFRSGAVCESCVGRRIPWPSIVHRCYRGSLTASTAVASLLTIHRIRETWTKKVDAYIALTDFARKKFVAGGLRPESVLVKPNFLNWDPECGAHDGTHALYVGRLSPEKGLTTLLDAWKSLNVPIPLKIVGTGPLHDLVAEAASKLDSVELLGNRPHSEVIQQMKRARLLVIPSEWYEGFPMTVVEAFATGLPVLASDIGSLSSIVEDGANGFLFPPGNASQLRDTLDRIAYDDALLASVGARARADYESKYSADVNYKQLMEVYSLAMRRRSGARVATETT